MIPSAPFLNEKTEVISETTEKAIGFSGFFSRFGLL